MSAGGAETVNGSEESKSPIGTAGLVDAIDHLSVEISRRLDLNRLPLLEPPVFAGDPLLYLEWSRSFDHLISIPM